VSGPIAQLPSLSRLGSMRAVAETHHLTTSTVSQQIAALARETGARLIESERRRVRLTPAGQRLAEHAVTILAGSTAHTSTSTGRRASRQPYGSAASPPESGSRCCRSSPSLPRHSRRSTS
jgi:DNA-binding transcriptional LysR family regulator